MYGNSQVNAVLGKWLVVTVGEPWDFSSAAGEGVLLGRVVEIVDVREEWHMEIYESVHFLRAVDAAIGSKLSIRPRYVDGDLNLISSGGREVINAMLLDEGNDNGGQVHVLSGGAALFSSCKLQLPKP